MEANLAIKLNKREVIVGCLKILLASTYAFYLKTQNYHWNLVGKEFYAMHQFFQAQYEELAEAIDEMAERVRALGFFVEGGLGIFKEKSFILDEVNPKKSLPDMIEQQVKDHEEIIAFMRKHLPEIESFHDGATADFLNKRLAVHEKMAWMLRSSL